MASHRFEIVTLDSLTAFATAIRDMWVQGAPLIGATAAYGIASAAADDARMLHWIKHGFASTRPTAINLRWALTGVEQQALLCLIVPVPLTIGHTIAEEDVETNRKLVPMG